MERKIYAVEVFGDNANGEYFEKEIKGFKTLEEGMEYLISERNALIGEDVAVREVYEEYFEARSRHIEIRVFPTEGIVDESTGEIEITGFYSYIG